MLPERRFAIASLVLGIIGLFYSGILFGGLAFIFSLVAMNKYYMENEASAGLVLGIIDICILLVAGLGLQFAYERSTLIVIAFLWAILEVDPYYLWEFSPIYFQMLEIFSHFMNHNGALTVSTFVCGPVPFYWVYIMLI